MRARTLGELLSQQRGSEWVHVSADGTALVGFCLDQGPLTGWRIGFRLQGTSAHAPWHVEEVTVLTPVGTQDFDASSIRKLPVGRYLEKARRAVAEQATLDRRRMRRPSEIDELSAFASRGPKRDLDYALLALRYIELVQIGDRKPAETIARAVGHGSPAVWTNRVAEARNKRGLLTPVKRGEAGGELTPRALDLLGIE